MALDYKDIQKCIKRNKPTNYPNPDDFDNYDDYAEAYDDEKQFYMQHIATLLDYKTYEDMLTDLDVTNIEDAEYDLFEFYYNNMVNEDYFDMDDGYYDDCDELDSDYDYDSYNNRYD